MCSKCFMLQYISACATRVFLNPHNACSTGSVLDRAPVLLVLVPMSAQILVAPDQTACAQEASSTADNEEVGLSVLALWF